MEVWIAVPALMAAVAFLTGGLDKLSAITGGIMGYMILFSNSWEWLVLLMLFFLLSSAATSYKYATKSKYRLSQKKRTVENVLGNGLVPLFFALSGDLVGFSASLAAATADTMSSEIGVLSKKDPVSIMDLKTRVKRGANGGISPLGNSMAFIGSAAIAGGCLFLFNSPGLAWVVLWAGVFGMFFDSVLGATLENSGIVGNHLVNFLSTLAAALVALGVMALI